MKTEIVTERYTWIYNGADGRAEKGDREKGLKEQKDMLEIVYVKLCMDVMCVWKLQSFMKLGMMLLR